MLARLQQIFTLSWLGGVMAWAAWKIHHNQAAWAWVAAAVVLVGYGLFMALEFLILVVQRRGDPTPQASASQLLKAWWRECISAPMVFTWHQPFRSQAQADFLPSSNAALTSSTGLVLIHGFLCNRGLWNPWMPRLRALGIPHIAVTLEPVFGSIDDYVPTIEAAVQRLQAATGKPPVIVAHSMGGLAARAWVLHHARQDVRVITIATPHQGTRMAHLGFARNAWQMRPQSQWLQDLARREYELSATPYAAFTCFYSHCDNIVMPPSAATLPGESVAGPLPRWPKPKPLGEVDTRRQDGGHPDNRHIAGSAHVNMLWEAQVFKLVCEMACAVGTETVVAHL